MPKSTYMYWQKRFDRGNPDQEIEKKVLEIREEHKNYGYRRILGDLRNQGYSINKKEVQRIVQKLGLQVTSYTHKSRKYSSYKGRVGTVAPNRNHVLESDYSEVIVVGAGADAVDYKLISICHKGDIVVSQDYGVAAMALGKGAYAIHQSGKWYTNDNIDRMLMERHLNKKTRRASGKII